MPKQGTWLRTATIAAIAAASLSLPMLSVAQADQHVTQTHATKMHPKKHAARSHPMRKQSAVTHGELYGAAPAVIPNAYGCTWPYRNQVPPCMGTWPQGDPNYHGTRPGPLFDE